MSPGRKPHSSPHRASLQGRGGQVDLTRGLVGQADGVEALRTDVAIVGGGLGACAAALAAARLGRRVILTEETHWVGGQLTNQVVPPDEHPWIEQFGATASYRTLRRGIRDYYCAHLPLTPEARASGMLNPGNGWVSRLCHDPRVAVAVLHQMMAPHQLSGRLFVMQPHRPLAAWTQGDRVTGVVVRGLESGRDSLIEAPFFIDATPMGSSWSWPAWSTWWGRSLVPRRANPMPPSRRIRKLSRRSRCASPSSIFPVRTTRSTSRDSMSSGASSIRRGGPGRCWAGPRCVRKPTSR